MSTYEPQSANPHTHLPTHPTNWEVALTSGRESLGSSRPHVSLLSCSHRFSTASAIRIKYLLKFVQMTMLSEATRNRMMGTPNTVWMERFTICWMLENREQDLSMSTKLSESSGIQRGHSIEVIWACQEVTQTRAVRAPLDSLLALLDFAIVLVEICMQCPSALNGLMGINGKLQRAPPHPQQTK